MPMVSYWFFKVLNFLGQHMAAEDVAQALRVEKNGLAADEVLEVKQIKIYMGLLSKAQEISGLQQTVEKSMEEAKNKTAISRDIVNDSYESDQLFFFNSGLV